MSTQPPGGPRRRRIAGERRGRGLPAETSPTSLSEPPAPSSANRSSAARSSAEQDELDRALAERSSAAAPSRVDLGKSAPPAAVPPPKGAATPTEETGPTLVDDLAGPDDEEPRRRTGWWGSRASLVLLSALLVLLLSLVGLAALGLLGTDGLSDIEEADATERSARTAPAAAEAAAAAILAYDYKTLDADADTATRYMTDEFATEYSDTFEKVVRPAAEQNRAKVTASVLASAAIRSTPDTARVLVYVDQTTVSRANPRPQRALNRVEMSMVRQGDSWMVADISSY